MQIKYMRYEKYELLQLFYHEILLIIFSDRPEEDCDVDGKDATYLGYCLPCLVGSYRDASVDATCQQCPDGGTTTGPGATSLDECIRKYMMTSWHGNAFLITGPLLGKSTHHRWIPS